MHTRLFHVQYGRRQSCTFAQSNVTFKIYWTSVCSNLCISTANSHTCCLVYIVTMEYGILPNRETERFHRIAFFLFLFLFLFLLVSSLLFLFLLTRLSIFSHWLRATSILFQHPFKYIHLTSELCLAINPQIYTPHPSSTHWNQESKARRSQPR